MEYQKGKLVEFTEEYQWDYTLGDKNLAKYGVVTTDTNGPLVEIETTDGIRVINQNVIHAYAWAGWVPEDLEPIWERYQENDWSDYD